MDKLAETFSRLQPSSIAKIEADVQRKILRDSTHRSQNLRMLPPLSVIEDEQMIASKSNPLIPEFLKLTALASKIPYPAPEILPCANAQPEKYTFCENPGKMACSACRLVSYCSKDCQNSHWRLHKQDCRNSIRSEDWQPSWVRENRRPFFVTEDEDTSFADLNEKYSLGLSLWGNTPAMDAINLLQNENDARKDMSLAFIASGDLRHVLQSVNNLPPAYSGSLDILINDINTPVACRNIVLLLILATIPDEKEAADIALHFWYSVFMPGSYQAQITLAINAYILDFIERIGSPIPLGPSSSITTNVPLTSQAKALLSHFMAPDFSVVEFQNEYDRVRTVPSRRDLRDRIYAGLKPSHRVAFQEYRRFGILLPFGAKNFHFNSPNASLFKLQCQWWQSDYADPLEGWDIDSIIMDGSRYGATAEDIYGCFYFSLSRQLQSFARRIRTTKIAFTVTAMDARDIPSAIQTNSFMNIPSSIRFDRIVVSNIFDTDYVGIEAVLTQWGPLLADTKHAAIVGYFMNWAMHQKDGRVMGADHDTAANLTMKVLERSGITLDFFKAQTPSLKGIMDFQVKMYLAMYAANALYENSTPFLNYLKAANLDGVLEKTKLKMRERHRIVPHRILAPLEGSASALPVFPHNDSWYNYTSLMGFTWTERFVEFERAQG